MCLDVAWLHYSECGLAIHWQAKNDRQWGQHSKVDSILAPHPAALSLNPRILKFLRGCFEVAEVN